ncbi:preprotein translocase subunit SecE [Luteibacter aegosomaticola]|jgi:preprotein translocase subunit SecE|uniref:preprotein translocase subunit SecE n=1 Tax=Luteibacter aegosomaticola TaxID=2911538 RepID=UPI001FFB044F|nr:preprotein translocase subunit SecE [Luteibacter aegosomaticola]UPG91240.1 preprotein translocase subunit SecE [Luteibacter aegosomaticola]
MNTKAQEAKGTSPADIGKLLLAFIVLAAGIVGFYYYADNPNVPGLARGVGVVVAVVAALAIGAFTAPGRKLRSFLAESQFELRKVVWPSRDETLKTTGIIIVVVIILSLLMGLIDWLLKSIVLDWLLKIGH